jgi:hypothetical protein
MLLPVVDEDEDEVPQDAPMTLAAAARPDTGRDRPQRTPLAELSPLSETAGVLRLRERGCGEAHRQDGRRGGTPEQNSPVIHEALHFDVVIAENMTRLVKLTVKLRRAIRRESDACGPDGETGLRPRFGYAAMTDGVSRAKQRSPQSIRHLFTIAPFQLGVWKSTGPRFAAFGEPIPDPITP